MSLSEAERTSHTGAYWAMAAVTAFSVNDMLVKFLSGDFALYQLMFIRAIVGIAFVAFIIAPGTGGLKSLRTNRIGMHILRGFCVVFANFCFFLGLASLPLADAVAIFFVSPMLITVFSVVFLRERVGINRWLAILIGLAGVIVVLRPGTAAFQAASLLPLGAALGYAMLHILTRRIGGTENATALVFYIQVTFLAASCVAGLAFGNGRFAGFEHPSLTFLFRPWEMPPLADFALIVMLGVTSSIGGYMSGQAYRVSEAALVAPFEYAAMPLAVFWGLVLFDEWPDGISLAGICLIMASGLFLVWREAIARRRTSVPAGPKRL